MSVLHNDFLEIVADIMAIERRIIDLSDKRNPRGLKAMSRMVVINKAITINTTNRIVVNLAHALIQIRCYMVTMLTRYTHRITTSSRTIP